MITLVGAGIGAGAAALAMPLITRMYPQAFERPFGLAIVYCVLCLLGALLLFLLSKGIIRQVMQISTAVERRWSSMPTQQILFSSIGLIAGLAVAALTNQLILSAGASLLTISVSAIVYLLLGTLGMQIGYRRYHESKQERRRFRLRLKKSGSLTHMLDDAALMLAGDEDDDDADADDADLAPRSASAPCAGIPHKYLDTSVIIDGRVFDIAKAGFLEGDIVIPQFVLAELRHIADSGDSLRRARGRRGLDVLGKLQTELKRNVVVDDTDYPDIAEVDVKLLRLCRDHGGVVVTNDYNLNKVAGVSGISVLNINDLANAVKPMLMAGEEMTVQIVREGKEPGQGVAYLDDGTMIVVDNGRRFVGENVSVTVTTVLQTSAGRMIFTRLKSAEDGAHTVQTPIKAE
ncbi:MAG TPA: TRAM domain-containing protein [Candidatus Limiplasma sp.]|nr:TRAM domain-containing protein [Candidatus Limiplasma sp.]